MIFYFTGTGNSFATAQIIANKTHDTLVDIGASYKYKRFEFIVPEGQNLGFVFPVYAGTTPPIIDLFLKHAKFLGPDGEPCVPEYTYVVITCGGFVGNTARFFADKLRTTQGINLDASFSVKSVGNYIYLYNPAQGKKRERLLEDAVTQTYRVAGSIQRKDAVHKEHRSPIGLIMSRFTEREDKPRSTAEFYTIDTCIGCGRCADLCPTNTITIIDGRPRWAEMGCTQCFGCLHRCPFQAIQYTKKTETRGRYLNPAYANRLAN